MDEQELEKQFEATDYDEDGNIKQTPPPPIAAKKKRVTIADLKKSLDDMESYIENEILAWCGQLDIRLDRLEATTTKHNDTLLSDCKIRLDILDHAVLQISDALPVMGKAIAELQQPHEQEIEFAQPPAPLTGEGAQAGSVGSLRRTYPPVIREELTATKGDIESVASVCQSMTDVLMICRALKAIHDLPDDDRLYVLQVAGKRAGVQITSGLQIRAGIKYVEA